MDNLKAKSRENLRRGHVKAAIANGRIEGFPPPSPAEEEIYGAYIRGDIDARRLPDAVKEMIRQQRLQHDAQKAAQRSIKRRLTHGYTDADTKKPDEG